MMQHATVIKPYLLYQPFFIWQVFKREFDAEKKQLLFQFKTTVKRIQNVPYIFTYF